MALLRSLPPPRQIGVLRAASRLEFRSVVQLASTQAATLLRGRSADVLRANAARKPLRGTLRGTWQERLGIAVCVLSNR